MSRVLLTGATGFLGRHILAALRDANVPAVASTRDPDAWPYAPEEVGDVVIGDSSEDVHAVIHAAGVVQHSRRSAEAMRFNVDGALDAVRTAHHRRARAILISSSGTVGCFRHSDLEADEDAPYAEATISRWPYYVSKLEAERQARRLADKLGVELVIVRPPVLLGPGDPSSVDGGHVTRVLMNRIPFVPTGGIGFADVRDVASAIARLTQTSTTRSVFHLPGTNTSLASFFQMVSEVSGVRVTNRRAPAWFLDGLALATSRVKTHALPDPVVLEMASHFWGVSSLWSECELGYRSRPARQTLADTVEWLRRNHPEVRQDDATRAQVALGTRPLPTRAPPVSTARDA